jgi:Fur family transcriptional regulator, ferric uptake regulator
VDSEPVNAAGTRRDASARETGLAPGTFRENSRLTRHAFWFLIIAYQLAAAMHKDHKEIGLLRDHLAKHQLKLTRQREQILNVFLRMEHITAEQMYRMLAKKDPHIGLATIYRTLNLFCEAGLAQARHFGTQTQYDNISHKGHHDHLICTDCGKIVEFENCDIERLQEEVARRNGFTIKTHKLELYGVCTNCRH